MMMMMMMMMTTLHTLTLTGEPAHLVVVAGMEGEVKVRVVAE
jgi:hypothetical protein